MKRLVAASLLLLLLAAPARASNSHTVYLPIVTAPMVFSIDCADGNGRLMECP